MGFKESFKKAFAIENSDASSLSEEDIALLEEMSQKIAKRRLVAPAVFFLESIQPLAFIGSQLMAFFGPFITMVFNKEKFDRLQIIFENRESVKILIDKIQEADIAQPKKRKNGVKDEPGRN